MSPSDLEARSTHLLEFRDQADYREWYKVQMRPWSVGERLWMGTVAADAVRRMQRAGVAHMPLRFVKVAATVEMGYPHTLGDTIVWNSSISDEPYMRQVELVIHEAIHVHQRHHPEWWRRYLLARGYHTAAAGVPTLIRNNPDIDFTVWHRPDMEQPLGRCYRSAHPRDLSDVTGVDHPYELEAYRLARMTVQT